MYPLSAEQLAEYHDDLSSHMIAVNIYTPLCFFYPLPDQFVKDEILKKLTQGIQRLSASFPWLCGQVVRPQSGLTQLEPYEETCHLTVKDYMSNASIPSMSRLRTAQFPGSMIDGETFTSLVGVPNSPQGEPMPIFFVQANFIDGGFVLSVASEHSTMDGQGTGQIVHLLSKACTTEAFTEEELLEGNRIRKGIIPLLDKTTYTPGPELDYLVEQQKESSKVEESKAPSKCTWAFIRFSSSNLAKLKSMATSTSITTADSSNVPYITSNDALSAFIWQCTSRARVLRLSADATTTIGRAVDARNALSVSPLYPGNVSNHAYSTLPLGEAASAPLSTIASRLRSVLQPKQIAHGIRSLASYFNMADDRSKIHYGSNLDFSRDLFLSSWAKLPCYKHDFGLGLGPPEAVRRPGFLEIEGLSYLLPMDRDGGVTAMICLRDEDLQALHADKTLSELSEWIG